MKIDQQLRGTTVWNDAQIFPVGVFTYDTDLHNIRMHDGVTAGGYVIPNTANIAAAGTVEFTAEEIKSTPPLTMTSAIMGKFETFTVAGTYTLPLLAAAGQIGLRVFLQATVAGVIISRQSADVISQLNVDVNTINLVQNTIYRLAKKSAARWIVLDTY